MLKNNKIVKLSNKSKHLKWFAFAFVLIIILLIVRLFHLQFVQGDSLRESAYKQITASSVISAKRGTIYDSTGKTLAISVQVDTVSINPSLISVKNNSEKTNVLKEKVAKGLSEILELDYEEVLEKTKSDSSVEVIAKKVETDKIEKLKNWIKDNNVSSGINIDEDTKRYYPYSNLASNLIGFCGNDNNGLAGIEYYWDTTLTGTPGRSITSIDATQDTIPDDDGTYVAPKNGSNITLSIDANIQTIVEKYLKQAVDENMCKDGGCMIIMNPTTGDILAMATYPDYNLNTPFEPNEALSATWDDLSSEEKSNSLYKMYRNRVVSDTYEPGSVFKIVTAAAGLEENVVESDIAGDFYCRGYQEIYDTKIKCTTTVGHGSQSLRNALEHSCNPALIQLGQRIGATTFYKYIEAFGFFDKTGIATSGEATGTFHSLEDVGPVELATTSFGQRFTITPLQMITAACSIANDGVLVQPKIVTKIENADTGAITNVETVNVRQVVSSETANLVCDMMESVVTDGGGNLGAVQGYSIGGKTGTSEPDPAHPENGYTSSFLAIAPIENTKLVALLTLFGPQGKEYYGGRIAAPVVSQVLNEVLPYLGIPSDDISGITANNDSVTIPDLKNKTVSDAKSLIEGLGLTCITTANSDEFVTSQMPKAGVSLSKNGLIKINTDTTDSVSVSVPDLKGKTLSEARSTLKERNLNIQYTGSGTVVSQEVSEGTQVEEGAVIKVTLQQTNGELH